MAIAAHLTTIRTHVPFCVHGNYGEGEAAVVPRSELTGAVGAANEAYEKLIAVEEKKKDEKANSEIYHGMYFVWLYLLLFV